jgi:hypothetical protein
MAAVPKYIADLQVGQARIHEKVDTILENMKKIDVANEKRDGAIRKLQNRQHWYTGVAAGAGAVIGTVVELIAGAHR